MLLQRISKLNPSPSPQKKIEIEKRKVWCINWVQRFNNTLETASDIDQDGQEEDAEYYAEVSEDAFKKARQIF